MKEWLDAAPGSCSRLYAPQRETSLCRGDLKHDCTSIHKDITSVVFNVNKLYHFAKILYFLFPGSSITYDLAWLKIDVSVRNH